jgi:hypothetical protein
VAKAIVDTQKDVSSHSSPENQIVHEFAEPTTHDAQIVRDKGREINR